jgi:hypothetical protein
MPIEIQMRDGVIEAVCHGKYTAQDIRKWAETVGKWESQLEVAPDRITDLSAANVSDLLSSEVLDFAVQRRGAKLKNRVKSAIIAPDPVQFGLARIFQTCGENPDIELRLFKDSESAYKWVGLAARTAPAPDA